MITLLWLPINEKKEYFWYCVNCGLALEPEVNNLFICRYCKKKYLFEGEITTFKPEPALTMQTVKSREIKPIFCLFCGTFLLNSNLSVTGIVPGIITSTSHLELVCRNRHCHSHFGINP